MQDKLIYGKTLAQDLRSRIKCEIEALTKEGKRSPALSIIIAGNDPASVYYAGLLKRAGDKDGICVDIRHLEKPSAEDVLSEIDGLNRDRGVDAVLVQLPLPEGIDKKDVFSSLDPAKDVDAQTPLNQGKILTKEAVIFPATSMGVLKILKGNNIDISGKKCVVIGRSTTVGLPAALLLMNENATVTVCHSKSRPLEKYTKEADILVVSAGKPNLIKKQHVKKDSVVIDVGTNDVDGRMVGDVDIEDVSGIAMVSPVIGGVGSLTLASLFENTLELYKKNIHGNRT
ncbi:MAG: bifunctional 5,10-methylenetetrahydrofolate dehydrogenase/5,10-methenyltetrahydrofolate cyclohydrolase [Elusimicrobia bacterium]|nr:bifunctional 5,10-methylenetetrahydrofolate dehydrogenase/5,10-methenyltetrahydrofolate cyclohydrolase [Elusimicrobiota bacterium]